MHRSWRLLLAVLVASLLATLGCGARSGSAQVATKPSATGGGSPTLELGTALELAPDVRTGVLDNGLSYYILRNAKPENRVELRLVLDAGSLQEDEDQRGLAHFVEHMAFNGTRHFAKQELVDYLELIGMSFGPDINAYTSFDETVYMLTVPMDDDEILDQAFVILRDWAEGIVFEDEEIDKERGVVLEEWRLGRGAGARIRDKQFPILFSGSRYAERLPIGDEEILKTAPYDTLRRFYRDWYRPDLMAVVAVGDIDPKRLERRIRKQFSGLEPVENPRPRELYPVPSHDETLISVVADPEMPTTRATVYYKMPKRSEESVGDYRRILVELLYHQMLNARLGELRQRPDPPFLFAGSFSGRMVRSRDVFGQAASVEEGKIPRGLEALLVEVERVDRHGFNESEFERTKTDLLRGFEQQYRERDTQQSSSRASELVSHFLTGEPAPGIEAEYQMAEELLPTIELAEVNRIAQSVIGDRDRVILASGPEKEEVPLPDEQELLGLFAATTALELEPWVDRVRDEPLVAESPTPGRILERSEIEELGITEWRLSNGVRVVLKPTDFKNDEIRLTGANPGGHSLVPDDEFVSAQFATVALRVGGLGEFDRIELEKALAGKMASAGVALSELEQTAGGWASPDDLQTLFELLYLSVTGPRSDTDAFGAWLERTRARVKNRLAQPNAVFRDRVNETLSQGHIRRKPISPEVLDEIDLDVAMEVFRERFADASGFTFVIVGNFDLETIEPLVLTYLGGLPSAGRSETWRDVGVTSPDGIERVEVHKGLEPKSEVRIVFTGDADWTREGAHTVRSLGELLRIRLREVLREDIGGTYGVSVSGGLQRWPREEYRFRITFGCAPENVETMVQAVFDEIEAVKRDGASEENLKKIREGQTRDREIALKENGFWTGALLNHYRHRTDPRLILQYEDLVAGITSDALRGAATLYLDTDRYVQGTLYPETTTGGE